LVVVGSDDTWRQRLMIATLCCNSIGVAGFRSAAGLHVMDRHPEGPIELLLPAPRKLRLLGVDVHVGPVDPQDITEVDGIRCTTIERTLCDLGAVEPWWVVEYALESAWRSGLDLRSLQARIDQLHRPGQHGTKVAQELVVEARLQGRPTESALEVRLEAIIGDIEGVVRQHVVRDDTGAFVARVDFAIPRARLAIEAHSKQFHSGAEAERRDLRRHERLVACGWSVEYVTSEQMKDPSKVRAPILRISRGT
jgi:very-short-patch-repair endonuclease